MPNPTDMMAAALALITDAEQLIREECEPSSHLCEGCGSWRHKDFPAHLDHIALEGMVTKLTRIVGRRRNNGSRTQDLRHPGAPAAG